jgi:hypothetical protein
MKSLKIFLAVVMLQVGVQAHAEDKSLSVGWSSIDIPNISGFKYSSVGFYEKLFPDSKSLEYIPKRRSDNKKGRLIIIHTPKQIEYKSFSENDFLQISSELKQRHKDIIQKMYQKGADQMGEFSEFIYMDLEKMEINNPISLGVILENNKSIGVVSMSKIEGSTLGVDIFKKIAIANIIMLVKGKLLTLEIHTSFDSLKDLDWIKRKSKLISSSIIKANE